MDRDDREVLSAQAGLHLIIFIRKGIKKKIFTPCGGAAYFTGASNPVNPVSTKKKMGDDLDASGDDEKLERRYANYFKVGHNAFEFLIDFGQFYSESQDAELCTRIITNPTYAKALLQILRESIKQYEQNFGAIQEEEGNSRA